VSGSQTGTTLVSERFSAYSASLWLSCASSDSAAGRRALPAAPAPCIGRRPPAPPPRRAARGADQGAHREALLGDCTSAPRSDSALLERRAAAGPPAAPLPPPPPPPPSAAGPAGPAGGSQGSAALPPLLPPDSVCPWRGGSRAAGPRVHLAAGAVGGRAAGVARGRQGGGGARRRRRATRKGRRERGRV